MPRIDFTYKRLPADPKKYGAGFSLNSLTKQTFESFNTSVLGLGDISQDGKYVQALVALCDLEGFTGFCNQVDSHLVIPEFLAKFLDWTFQTLANHTKEGETADRVRIWGSLPLFAKFLGDGVLFLWDTQYSGGASGIRNIIADMYKIVQEYQADFLPTICKHVNNPPLKLRCGIARGQVVSVGDGNDYVGSCINMAARLQKLSSLSFAVARRGIDLSSDVWKAFTPKRVDLRGIGEKELVYIPAEEFDALDDADKGLFIDP